MDTRVKALWTDALRFGEYKQTREALARLDSNGNVIGYCCLGVLCDLAVKEGVIPPPVPTWDDLWWVKHQEDKEVDNSEAVKDKLNFGTNNPEDATMFNSTSELPNAVREWARLASPIPTVEVPILIDHEESRTMTSGLADINDDGADFTEIADLIEDQL